ncbi:hypothetical protein ACTWQB_16660 [Piscibacillus sp. B03]|uniref:hypothetical protein n=1 Tax=Piscibacillus sp. B03 TaxID=3457430 RepID=UPI003FCC6334
MLQKRINELNSAILEFEEDKVYVWGFTTEKMLPSYSNKGLKCWSSQGLYDIEELEYYNIKDNALIVVKKRGKEIGRYQYKPIYKDTVKIKDDNGKEKSVTFAIRKSTYTNHYHLFTEKTSLLFESEKQLKLYLFDEFNVKWGINYG